MTSNAILPASLPAHPRLLASVEDWARLRANKNVDPVSTAFSDAIIGRADRLLGTAPLTRVMTGRRLLMVSREALGRIIALALAANVTGEARYVERAKAEMLAVVRFTGWNPAHFLDTAEMSLAVAIGYDWLYEHFADDERHEIRTAIVEKGIRPSLDASAAHNWWHDAAENWNQVCHGGLGAAAIAIAEDEPELAEMVLRRALDKLPVAAAAYAPEGIYPEGPMYWAYGTSYHVVLCEALLRLTGQSFGLDSFPGFAASPDFIEAMTAPSGRFFNFGDCAEHRRLQPPLFWFARRFNQPRWIAREIKTLSSELATYAVTPEEHYGHYSMLGLAWLWYDRAPPATAASSGNWHADGPVPLTVLRSGGLYLAAKGGSASVGHAHMDAGGFILESDGVRWAVDPGMQDYESFERLGIDLWNQDQESERWRVFRLGPPAHNILRFDGGAQSVAGHGTLARFDSAGEAVFDLSALYPTQASRVTRSFTITAEGIVIEDAWVAARSTSVAEWQFLTTADVAISASTVQLREAGQSLELRVLEPATPAIVLKDVSAPTGRGDAANPGLKRITISCPATAGCIKVLAIRAQTNLGIV